MRTVFNNDMVAHVWASQNQSHGRNSSDSFYFQGRTIYSYGSHFPIARFETMPNGERVVLFTTREYSVTTRAHMSRVRRALRGQTIVYCDDPEIFNRGFWDGLQWDDIGFPQDKCVDEWRVKVEESHSLMAKAKRARKYGAEYLRDAQGMAQRANEWRDMIGMPVEEFPDCVIGDDNDPAIAEIERKARESEAREKTERILRACRNEIVDRENEKLRVEYLREWRRGNEDSLREKMDEAGLYGWGTHAGRFPSQIFGNAYCRVNGDKVETSMRAEIPVSHAKRVFLRLMDARNKIVCVDIPFTFTPIRVGHFQIDRVDANGLHAGCHTIAWREIDYVARELGLIEG